MEIQSKAAAGCPFPHPRMAVIEKTKITNVSDDVEKLEPIDIVQKENGAAYVCNSLAFPKTNNHHTVQKPNCKRYSNKSFYQMFTAALFTVANDGTNASAQRRVSGFTKRGKPIS